MLGKVVALLFNPLCMCGFIWNQHYYFISKDLRLNKNMFCFVAVTSRSCGFMNKISIQYRIPPAI